MPGKCSVTVVLCSYNRASLLGCAIERLLQQSATSPPFELIVVDNNSTDDTRAVVERYRAAAPGQLRYLFEPKQGLTYARNAGILAARADVIAFTDDDVRVGDRWVEVIRRTFDAHPYVDCLGGRTVPEWPVSPPAWLTRLHWVGPLALQDYGDDPFVVDSRRPLCLAGANIAFRRQVFERIGLFSPDYPRSEDTELMIRLWLAGARTLYVPEMMSYAAVQHERLSKWYHRRWHLNIGRCNARMAFGERTDADGSLRNTLPQLRRVLGIPRFAMRQLAVECLQWARHLFRGRAAEGFWHELQARAIIGYMYESAAIHRRRRALRRPSPATVSPRVGVDDVEVASAASPET